MRACEKRKAHKAACRQKAAEGLINAPNGSFERPKDESNSMVRDYFAGYHFGRRRKEKK